MKEGKTQIHQKILKKVKSTFYQGNTVKGKTFLRR